MSNNLSLMERTGDLIIVTGRADQLKKQALAVGALVGAVTDDATNSEAVEAMKSIKAVLNEVESARKRVKEPMLEMARRIDNAAKEFSAELTEEFQRIQRASADYQTAQLERVREQERKRAEEAARIERERQEALRKIEQERREAEAAARAKAEAEMRAARDAKAREEAEARAKAESERIAKEAEARAKAEVERGQQEFLAAAPAIAKPTAAGQTARAVWQWEVTDIWTLARTSPGLVEITPRRQEINDVIARVASSSAEAPKIPGLRIWEEVKVGVRVGRGGKVVDV